MSGRVPYIPFQLMKLFGFLASLLFNIFILSSDEFLNIVLWTANKLGCLPASPAYLHTDRLFDRIQVKQLHAFSTIMKYGMVIGTKDLSIWQRFREIIGMP